MNEAAYSGAGHQTQRPQDEQYYGNCVQHTKLWLVCRLARSRTSRQSVNDLPAGHRRSNGHVVDHARHAVDVRGEFGNEAYFSGIGGNAAHSDDTIGG
jgi:hypothetical protein